MRTMAGLIRFANPCSSPRFCRSCSPAAHGSPPRIDPPRLPAAGRRTATVTIAEPGRYAITASQRLRDGAPAGRPSGGTRRDRRQRRGARRTPGPAPRSRDLPAGDARRGAGGRRSQPGGAPVPRGERAAAPAARRGQAREHHPAGFRAALLVAPDRQGAPRHPRSRGAQPRRPAPLSRRRLAGRRRPRARNHRTGTRPAAARLPHRRPAGARALPADGLRRRRRALAGRREGAPRAPAFRHPVARRHRTHPLPGRALRRRSLHRPRRRELPAAGIAGGVGRPADGGAASRPRATPSARRARRRRSRRRTGSRLRRSNRRRSPSRA